MLDPATGGLAVMMPNFDAVIVRLPCLERVFLQTNAAILSKTAAPTAAPIAMSAFAPENGTLSADADDNIEAGVVPVENIDDGVAVADACQHNVREPSLFEAPVDCIKAVEESRVTWQ